MNKLATITVLTLGMSVSSWAQGFFNFDNTSAYTGTPNNPNYAIIGPSGHAGQGAIGATIGSDGTFATPNYDMGFIYQLSTADVGMNYTASQFLLNGGSLAPFVASFSAPTGDDADGAGAVGAGSVAFGSGAGQIGGVATSDAQLIGVQLIAWYDPTGSTSYATALANGWNVGNSSIFQVRLAAGLDTTVADLSLVPSFTVQAVPEPATFALAGLGGLASLVMLRRKQA